MYGGKEQRSQRSSCECYIVDGGTTSDSVLGVGHYWPPGLRQQGHVCKAVVMPSMRRKTCSNGRGQCDQSALPSAELTLY